MVYPSRYALTHTLLERKTESAVTTVTAFVSQLLSRNGALAGDSLMIETDEVVDAEVVDIGIVCDALTGEILAEIEAVGTNNLSQLKKAQIVLQVEFRAHTALFQQLFDIGGDGQGLLLLRFRFHRQWFFQLLFNGRTLQLGQSLYSPQQEEEQGDFDEPHDIANGQTNTIDLVER